MEDEHAIVTDLGLPGFSLFCVFDGHGGRMTATWIKTNLPKNIQEALIKTVGPVKQTGSQAAENEDTEPKVFEEMLRTVIHETDEQLRKAQQAKTEEPAQMSRGHAERSGCTAVIALVTPTHIIVANIGDSRAVLSTGGKTRALSYDHKPEDEVEMRRIEAAGSKVIHGRVDRDLNLSRSLGDFRFKQYKRDDYDPRKQPISPDPDFVVYERNKAKDEFMFLACDGIWDVMSNDIAASFIRNVLKTSPVVACCQKMNEQCLQIGSLDNMTSMIVLFEEGPQKCNDRQGLRGSKGRLCYKQC